MFSDEQLRRIEELAQRYQHPQSVILEALWMWQDTHGWISEEGMKAVAGVLGVPVHHVYGVVTFYTMFNRAPVGRHKIEVCTNVSCLGSCGTAPMMQIGDTYYENLDEGKIDKILNDLA
jgi:NADH:ubiquinone oxidoreductase subunit E